MATSTDDVALVLGASQYQLRVFNLSGEKVCEKAHSNVTKAFQVPEMEESSSIHKLYGYWAYVREFTHPKK